MRHSTGFIYRASTALLVYIFTTSLACAQDYKIKLARPDKVDDQYTTNVVASSKQSIQVTVNGQAQPAKTTDFTAELQGVIKVLAVNSKTGEATKVSCKIDKLTGDGKDLYPSGTTIIAEKSARQSRFTIDGNPVAAANNLILDAVITVGDPDRTTSADDMNGTDQTQKVGDTWMLHATNISKEMNADGLPISPDDIKGESKLIKVKKLNGTPVMVISTTVAADGFKADGPNGTSVTDGNLHVDVTETFPVDESLPQISQEVKMKSSMTINLPNGLGTSVVTVDREVKEHREAVQ